MTERKASAAVKDFGPEPKDFGPEPFICWLVGELGDVGLGGSMIGGFGGAGCRGWWEDGVDFYFVDGAGEGEGRGIGADGGGRVFADVEGAIVAVSDGDGMGEMGGGYALAVDEEMDFSRATFAGTGVFEVQCDVGGAGWERLFGGDGGDLAAEVVVGVGGDAVFEVQRVAGAVAAFAGEDAAGSVGGDFDGGDDGVRAVDGGGGDAVGKMAGAAVLGVVIGAGRWAGVVVLAA